jgi:AcrR family transcriptional regulator
MKKQGVDEVEKRSKPAAHRGNRYGRSEAARDAVLRAADDLLVELGFARLTIEAIALRAGVGKQTIYRWWASKTDILLDTFLDDALQEILPQDSGDLKKDLCTHLANLAKFLTQSDSGFVFRALVGQAQNDPAFAEKFRGAFLNAQRDIDRMPLLSAIRRGDLDPKTDVELAIDSLLGPIYYRVLVTGASVTRPMTDALVEQCLRGIGREGESR